jgi:hypothetical protein
VAIKTLADLNRINEQIWERRRRHSEYLLARQYTRTFIRERFVEPQARRPETAAEALDRIRKEKSFYAQISEHEEHKRNTGAFDRQRAKARQPRRKALRIDLSRREIVGAFASQPENLGRKTKALWGPFFNYLQNLGLHPTQSKHFLDLDRYCYQYDGKRGRLSITHRQFEKLVSELAPRRQ